MLFYEPLYILFICLPSLPRNAIPGLWRFINYIYFIKNTFFIKYKCFSSFQMLFQCDHKLEKHFHPISSFAQC